MEPNIWGPHAWLFLHTITLNFPDNPTKEEKEKYKQFFILLSDVLPCDKCKKHYLENIKNFPINVDSKESLTKWLFTIHNEINIINNKNQFNYTDFINKYSDIYNKGKNINIILYIILIIVVIFIFLKKK